MAEQHKKTLKQKIKWWWNTRVTGLFRVRLAGAWKKNPIHATDTINFNHIATELPQPNPDGITVILTAYRRTEYLADQIKALRNQTIP